jgi:hypothetical protein
MSSEMRAKRAFLAAGRKMAIPGRRRIAPGNLPRKFFGNEEVLNSKEERISIDSLINT